MLNIFKSKNKKVELPHWAKEPEASAGYLSQYGQDHWVVERVFEKSPRNRYFVELGAADGLLFSNTAVLEKQFGWNGLLIEPSKKFSDLAQNRKCPLVNACISSEEGYAYLAEMSAPSCLDLDPQNNLRSATLVASTADEARHQLETSLPSLMADLPEDKRSLISPDEIVISKIRTTTLETVLRESQAPEVIDYLSLDVEGHELEVLQGFPFSKYRILSMNIERPCEQLMKILSANSYRPVAKNSCDIFFVHSSLPY